MRGEAGERVTEVNSFLPLTSPMPFKASSAIPDWLVAPFWSRSKSSSRAKFFFRPQTPESPKQM